MFSIRITFFKNFFYTFHYHNCNKKDKYWNYVENIKKPNN